MLNQKIAENAVWESRVRRLFIDSAGEAWSAKRNAPAAKIRVIYIIKNAKTKSWSCAKKRHVAFVREVDYEK